MALRIEPAATLEGHADRAWSLGWHPTQPVLASCSGDKSVHLAVFRLNNADSISFVRPASTALPLTHTRTVRNLAWNPVTGTLATASFDSTVGLWESMSEQGIDDGDHARSATDLESWDCVSSLEGHESEVKAVAWNHDGKLLATCGRDKSVWVWEFDSESGEFECLAVLMDHTQDVKSIAWHPKEDILASASYDDTIRIYQADIATDDWACTHVLPPSSSSAPRYLGLAGEDPPLVPLAQTGHTSTVWGAVFSPCGQFLASCSDDTSIRVWRRIVLPLDQLPDKSTVYRIGAADKERWECALLIDEQFYRTVYSLDWTLQPSLAGQDSLGCIVAGGSDGKLAVFDITSKDGMQLDFSILASVENAHGISDINAVRWCTTKPQRPPSSDEEDEDGAETTAAWDVRWRKATDGLFGSAGDDGLVRIWKVRA